MAEPLQTIADQTAALCTELEAKRQRYWRLFLMGAPMSFAFICAIAATKTDHGVFPWPIVLVLTLVVVTIGFQIANGVYRAATKKALLGGIAEALGLEYQKNGVFPVRDMERHKIIPPHDTFRIEDGFQGVIKGVPVAFEEIILSDHVQHERADGTREKREEMVFWGLAIRIGIGKTLEAHTVVLPRNAAMTFFRTVFSAFERVNLVSPKFEEMFDVMSTSQLEARYVLDPAFMERFMEAGKLLGSKWMEASFTGNEIAFAVQRYKPMFEIGWIWKPLTDKSLESVTNEIKAIITLIEVLKLNPYTGLGAALPSRKPAEAE